MKTVYQYSLEGELIAEYIGLREAQRITGCKSILQSVLGQIQEGWRIQVVIYSITQKNLINI